MPSLHFTELAIQRLKTQGEFFDTTTPCFGVRIGKHRKTWFVIRGKGNQRLRTTIGQFPDISLGDARTKAKALLNSTPIKVIRIKFGEAYDLFKIAIENRKARTQRDYKRLLEKHFLPVLKARRIDEIEYEDVMEAVAALPPGEKAHALSVARILFRWCIRPPRRYVAHSPLEGLQVPGSNRRRRVLTSDELKIVWAAAQAQGYPHGTIVQLLILTGQRRGEIASLRWSWIDQKERIIALPEWLTKNSKGHSFPYSSLVSGVLGAMPRLESVDLLFPSRVSDDRPLSGWSKYKQQLRDGIPAWTLHDLRRTYRTLHAQIGTRREIAERLINHVTGVITEVERIYDVWTYMPQMREAIEQFKEHLDSLLVTS